MKILIRGIALYNLKYNLISLTIILEIFTTQKTRYKMGYRDIKKTCD